MTLVFKVKFTQSSYTYVVFGKDTTEALNKAMVYCTSNNLGDIEIINIMRSNDKNEWLAIK